MNTRVATSAAAKPYSPVATSKVYWPAVGALNTRTKGTAPAPRPPPRSPESEPPGRWGDDDLGANRDSGRDRGVVDQHLAGGQRLTEHQLVPLQQADLRQFGFARELALAACRIDRELLATKQFLGIEGQVDRCLLHDAQQDRCRCRDSVAEGGTEVEMYENVVESINHLAAVATPAAHAA